MKLGGLGARSQRLGGALVIVAVLTVVAVEVVGMIRDADGRARIDQAQALGGCGGVHVATGPISRRHLPPGTGVVYDSYPPTSGAHAVSALKAGVLRAPISYDPAQTPNLYEAVHSLEHGYVIVWYEDLRADEVAWLRSRFAGAHKVIVAPGSSLPTGDHIVLTAWARRQDCRLLSEAAVDAFIDRYREASSAPEAKVP